MITNDDGDMPKIAISYRRADSLDITGRIFDRLTDRYGRGAVFRDIDSIPPGSNFREHLWVILAGSDVLMVVVGPNWIGENSQGQPKIHAETDFVRTEVEIALSRGIPLIPVLVGDASMPEPNSLPENIREFAYRNAFEVDSGRDFDHHINGLLRATDDILRKRTRELSEDGESQISTKGVRRKTRPFDPFLSTLGGVMTVLGLMHLGWFTSNLASSVRIGAVGQLFLDVWSYADMAFGIGGLTVGLGTLFGQPWARLGGIVVCLLASFSNVLWFIEIFDKSLTRLELTGTGFATLLFILCLYLYLFRWPVSSKNSQR